MGMHLLDQKETFKKFDSANMLGSIAALQEQCNQAWKESRRIALPSSYRRGIDQVVVAGMGGSALGGHIIASTFAARLTVPFSVVSGYALPRSVTSRSVVILSSYSGNTEETIANAKEAIARRARCIGITTGGALAQLLRRRGVPSYVFDPRANPCGQPRMALGYSLFGQLGILTRLGVLALTASEYVDAVRTINVAKKRYAPQVPKNRNTAKRLAIFFHGSVPLLMGPDVLLGALHTFANQINENAKTVAAFFAFPELNHHLIEGLRFPSSAKQSLRFFLCGGRAIHPRIEQRLRITKTIIEKNRYTTWHEALAGKTPFATALSLLVLGSYTSFYMGLLHHRDPSAIPWVDYLKQRLAK